MPFIVLKPGETTGETFRVKGGRYLVSLFGRTAGSDIQIMMTDARDPQAGDWARAGIVWNDDDTADTSVAWMGGGFAYRIVATDPSDTDASNRRISLGPVHQEFYDNCIDR